jgi:trimeric autotransporter adhesin
MDNSKLYIHTVIPAVVNIANVNENNNPDNTFGSNLNYVFNTNTWRAEVNVPNNPLKQDLLTVLQPGPKATMAEMITTALQTSQNNMEGAIVKAHGNTELVLFNNSTAKFPLPVAVASYAFTGAANTVHTLCGLAPNQNYAVTYVSSVVTVKKIASGTTTASPSGVLRFTIPLAELSGNAALSGLTLNNGVLSPAFAPAAYNYTANVANNITSIKVTPVTAAASATITVNGKAVVSGAASTGLPLAVGPNVVSVIVTAQDGTTTTTYKSTITRAAAPVMGRQQPDDDIVVHAGISPNGDGIDDFLLIDGINAHPDNKLTIMDIAGTTVYQVSGYDNSSKVFNGRSKSGRLLLPGTYFYQVEYQAESGLKRKTGYIVIKY